MSILEQLTPDEIVSLGREIATEMSATQAQIIAKASKIKLDDMTSERALDAALDAFSYTAQDGPYTADTLKHALAAAMVAAWTYEEGE